MTSWKLLTTANWILISMYGVLVLYALAQQGSGMGHEMPGMGTIIKGVAIFLLLLFIGLNWLPYQWTKIMALILMALLMLLVYLFVTD